MSWPITYLAIDTETTGLGNSARILELAIVVMREREVFDSYHSYFNPPDVDWDSPDVRGALKVNGLKPEELVGKPTFQEELPNIFTHLRRSHVWVGHNISFDIRMIQQETRRCGVELNIAQGVPGEDKRSVSLIDTKMLFKAVSPSTRHRLEDAAEHFGIKNAAAHTAHADAVTCAEVMCEIIDKHAGRIRLPPEIRLTASP